MASDLLQVLPSIRETKDADEKRRLFIIKLRLCSFTFDFTSKQAQSEAEAREMKRRMLVELIDHLSSSKIWVSEESLKAILHMIGCNLFRPLPPSQYVDFDPEEDEPTHDPAWVHLQFVYEFLLRFIVSNNTDAKLLKKFIDRKFLVSIINLFHSEDPRERDYLKTILHRIYGKFMSFRSFLRRAMNDVFYDVIYTGGAHNGLAELLEILGSIINGFATPLKEEHQLFLRNILIPLHKANVLNQFHAQLAYCIVQFIEKDPRLASQVVGGLLKFWPQTSCNKELLFLSELEEVLEMTQQPQLESLIYPVFWRISACICSNHFQVAERALFLWNNDVIAAFMSDHRPVVLPLLYPALYKNANTHWNSTVTQLTSHIMQQFRDMDEKLYISVEEKHIDFVNSNTIAKKRRENWAHLRLITTQNAKNAVI
jgi:serine/threonine-protein phosphatase 2A regulatory subunit B'